MNWPGRPMISTTDAGPWNKRWLGLGKGNSGTAFFRWISGTGLSAIESLHTSRACIIGAHLALQLTANLLQLQTCALGAMTVDFSFMDVT